MKRYRWVEQLPPHIKSELLRDAFEYLVREGYPKREAVEIVEGTVKNEKVYNVIEPEFMWGKYARRAM